MGQMATQQQVDAGIFQAALLQIAEATQAAATAAQAAASARSSTAGTASSSASEKATIDWSKLVNKPQVFDHASQEQDQRHYRDWLWQLTQYLICVDEGFSKELSQITDEPSKPLDMSSAPSDVRQRSAKLYGLLAGLVKNRALAIVRAAAPGDGFVETNDAEHETQYSSTWTSASIHGHCMAWVHYEQTTTGSVVEAGGCLRRNKACWLKSW